MRIDVTCVDFTRADRVAGVELTCTVKVAPRIIETEPFEPDDGPVGPIPAVQVDDDNGGPEVITRIIVLESQAVVFPARSATSDGVGKARFDLDVAADYERLTAANEDDDRFLDVAAFVRIRGRVDGLDRESPFVLSSTSADSPTGDVGLDRVVLIDLAKSIVGHTTGQTCRLWFQLHGSQLADRRYECEVRPVNPGVGGQQTRRVSFSAARARTTALDVGGLVPGGAYEYRLWSRRPENPAGDRIFCQGSFRTAGTDERELTVLFGSCHKPLDTGFYDPFRDLRQWRRLADRSDGDVQLFIGDQVYCDEVREPEEGQRWFDGYVRRYNAFWSFQPLRHALSRRPTYMTPDDHEVKDDWGIDDSIPTERIDDAVAVVRAFQLAHSPSGFGGPVHYHFRRGPVAFFVMDARTERGKDEDFPIFGATQWRDFVAWARSAEARSADVIVFGSPVPVALLPVEAMREVIEDAATATGAVTGTLVGAGIGAAVGGPLGAAAGAGLGAVVGGAGANIAYDEIEEERLVDYDVKDMWAFESNQKDLSRLLNVLFNLANDIDLDDPDAGPGARPRAVFVLGGDCHFGLIHMVASDRRGGPDHRRNPQIMQLTSSAIGRPPQNQPVMRLLFSDVDENPPDFSSLVENLSGDFQDMATKFVLDDQEGEHYRAAALGALFERNLGSLRIERVGAGRRYRFDAMVEGETRSLVQLFEVDLDTRPVRWRSLVGQILSLQGRLTLLRVNELGGMFGPPFDRLDAEVIISLDTAADRFFGFQLRRNLDQQTRTQMLDTLRSALNHNRPMRIDYRRTGVRNGELIRVNVLA